MSNCVKPLILIFGATGAQGGSVVNYLLNSGKFTLRAVTRNTSSENAKALSKRGVEMVAGDFATGIPESAYNQVHGVFLVTNYWDASSFGKEYEQSVPVIDAAFKAGVTQFVYSSLPNCELESGGKYKVDHFTTKSKVENYIRQRGFKYTAFPAAGFYYQNFNSFFPPKLGDDGKYSITMPKCKLISGIDITQFGGVVELMFEHPEKYDKIFLPIACDNQSPQYYVDAISEKIGKSVHLNLVTLDVFASFGFPGAHDLAEMFGFIDEFGSFGKYSWDKGKECFPKLKTFKEWLVESDYHI